VICGVELELDRIADLRLRHVWHECMATLCVLLRPYLIATGDDINGRSRTLATATVRVIGSLLDVAEAEVEEAAAVALTICPLTNDSCTTRDESRARHFHRYILSRISQPCSCSIAGGNEMLCWAGCNASRVELTGAQRKGHGPSY
jgi:hypothetical protein